jgi:acyl carrier protein
VETFRRLVTGPRLPQVVVCPRDLAAYRRRVRAFDRDRVAEELAALAAGTPAAARPATGGAPYQAPEGDLERRIAAVWQRVLGIEQVGVNDNFFELGGTSLAGIQLVSELKRELGAEIPTVTIFEAPTVAALARHLGSGDGAAETAERAGDRAARKQAALAARRRERRAARTGRGGEG